MKPLQEQNIDELTSTYRTHPDPAMRKNALARMEEMWSAKETRLAAPDALAKAATWYAKNGIPIFPCKPGQKQPATRHGFKDATTNLNQINTWWTSMPQANIGLPTGHLFDVVDVDDLTQNEHVHDYMKNGSLATPILIAYTPRGIHYYIPPTGNGNATNLLPGVDYRGHGGYVLAPPSRITPTPTHPGGKYWWTGFYWPQAHQFHPNPNTQTAA